MRHYFKISSFVFTEERQSYRFGYEGETMMTELKFLGQLSLKVCSYVIVKCAVMHYTV